MEKRNEGGVRVERIVRPNPFEERRFGMFSVDAEHLKWNGEEIQKFLCNCLIVRAEHHWDSNHIEYTACGMEFDPVEEGHRAPRYDVLFTKHEDGRLTYEFVRRAA